MRAAGALAAAAAAAASGGAAGAPAPFFDYDCVSVQEPLLDWSALQREASAELRRAELAREKPRPPPETGRVLVLEGARALEECPLAVLYLAVAHFYAALAEPEGGNGREAMLQLCRELARAAAGPFSAHAVAASRWPVFEALAQLSERLPVDEALTCDGIQDGIVDWRELRRLAVHWAETWRIATLFDLPDEVAEEAVRLKLEAAQLQTRLLRRGQQAREECPAGALWAFLTQVLTSATRTTQHLTAYSHAVDEELGDWELLSSSASGWPIFEVLAWIADANKGVRYVHRDPKYLRRFGDLDLLPEELAPLAGPAPRPADGESEAVVAWRRRLAASAGEMARLPWRSFACALRQRAATASRPILRGMLSAVLSAAGARQGARRVPTAAACKRPSRPGRRLAPPRRGRSLRRRALGLMLLYGERWSPFLLRTVRHLERVGFTWPLLVVSIGDAASAACQAARRRGAEPTGTARPRLRVACWRPSTKSQVHRFTITHVLLHLGVDVFYFDTDTFFLRNPLPAVLAQAARERSEILFASHADGDCVNIGLFYLRATPRTALWFSHFLQWYHDYQYEIDQRGLDIFLGRPRRQPHSDMGVSFPPRDEVIQSVRTGALEDTNRVVIGFIGWAGDLAKMLVFHWCNLPLERKWRELNLVYDAAEALEGLAPFSLAVSTAAAPGNASGSGVGGAGGGGQAAAAGSGPWALASAARAVFEAYRLPEAPQRLESTRCW